MAIEKKQIPFAPPRGLYLDGPTVPGALSKAENIIILQDGTMERRPSERTLAESAACLSGRGPRRIYELLKSDGTRYLFADMEQSETTTSAFGAELVDQFASWIAASGWTYGSSKWTHSSGTTALSAIVSGPTNDFTPSIGATYRIVADITCPIPAATAEWVYTHTDSTYDWITKTGNSETVWLNQWTHSTAGTTALICADFTPAIGSSYVVQVHVTHTSGTSVTVTMGGLTLGTITATGTYTYIARYCTTADYLKFTPTSDWRGSINKTWPRVQNLLDNWCSAVKLITPDAPNLPSYYDYTASPHFPASVYYNGAELITNQPTGWYPGAAAYISQSVVVGLGGVSNSVTTSGVYTFDVTATSVAALTFTPTTSWTGSVNSASVQVLTQGTAETKTKVIGGEVTGTTDYEVVWSTVLPDLTTGAKVIPQWATLQDRCFRVDGTNKNYWFTDASEYHTLGCPAPTSDPVTASTTGGSILAGSYNVYYTYVKKYGSGSSLYVVEGNPSSASSTTIAGTAITCAVVACTEADVSHIRIYRTLYGEPGSYAYFDQEVANITNTVTLIQSDDEIRDINTTLEFDHDMPPIGKFILGAGSRLWLVDTQGTIHWSRLDQPELMPSQNYMTFDPRDGDDVMGLCALRKHILVFKRRRTWLLDMFSESVSDDGIAALAKDVVSSVYGCIATGSIQAVGTDSAIWLSHAGFMLYNGGSIKNISGGYVDSDGGVIPSRIQSVVESFLAKGAENFMDSVYHSARQLYHVNFLYRDPDGVEIVSQRHLVYGLTGDAWTEYVYRNLSGEKVYETNFAMAHDALGREVILIPYLVKTTGTTTYIYQGEYDAANYTDIDQILISANTALDWVGVYKSDDYNGTYFSRVATGENIEYVCDCGSGIVVGGGWYAKGSGVIYRSTDYGDTWTKQTVSLEFQNNNVYCKGLIHLGSGIVLAAIVYIDSTIFIYRSTDYGLTWTKLTWSYSSYCSGIYVTDLAESVFTNLGGGIVLLTVCKSSKYFVLKSSDSGATWAIQSEAFFTTLDSSNMSNIVNLGSGTVVASAEHASSSTGYYLVKSTDYGATWSNTSVECGAPPALYLGNGIIMTGEYRSTDSGTTFSLVSTLSSLTPTVFCDLGNGIAIASRQLSAHLYISRDYGKSWYTLPDTMTDYAVNIIPLNKESGYWKKKRDEITETEYEPETSGTFLDIVSNYNNWGIANEKRIGRVYLPVAAQYGCAGAFTLEPDHGVNMASHTDGESSEPTGATSLRPFAHAGQQDWVYTNNQFDSTIEQWDDIRIDVGAQGKAFRFSIRAGDFPGGGHGFLRIRPPYVEAQIKSKQ